MTDPGTTTGAPAGPPPLTTRVVKGAGWVFAGRAVRRGADLVKIIVLARLLSPADFGLFGIVMLAIATLDALSQTGLNIALIQHKDRTEAYLDTAWTVQVIRGLVMVAVLFGGAPAIGWFFDEPRAVLLLRVACVSVALGGFVNIGIIYFQKELEFHKHFLYNALASAVSLPVAVILAYHLRSVWALVWAGLAEAAARCAVSYVLHPYRPRLRFNGAQARELFRFGRWVLGSSVLIFAATHGDDALVGKMLGVAALGLYQMAYRIANMAATEITHTVSAVTFPAYSKIQEDIGRLREAYLRTLALTMFLATPVAAGIAAVAPVFVSVVLGPKWQAAVLPMQLLCIYGLARAYAASMGPACYAVGRPRIETVGTLLYVLGMSLLLWPMARAWGLPGVCLAVVAPLGCSNTYVTWRVLRLLRVSPVEVLKRVTHPLACGLAMFALLVGLRRLFAPSAVVLVLLVCVGATVYLALTVATRGYLGLGLTSAVRSITRSLSSRGVGVEE